MPASQSVNVSASASKHTCQQVKVSMCKSVRQRSPGGKQQSVRAVPSFKCQSSQRVSQRSPGGKRHRAVHPPVHPGCPGRPPSWGPMRPGRARSGQRLGTDPDGS
eukprot:1132671-Pelagomonas_calceolata.AAC.1